MTVWHDLPLDEGYRVRRAHERGAEDGPVHGENWGGLLCAILIIAIVFWL